jgi:large subunit ribosomal protein L18
VRKALRKLCTNHKLRVSVFRSLKYVSAQAIDDVNALTLASISSKNILTSGDKSETSYQAGVLLGQKILELGHKEILFDRGQCLYHGRIKKFADGIRSTGISF